MLEQEKMGFKMIKKHDMIVSWEKRKACGMNIDSPDILLWGESRGYLESREPESLRSSGLKKSALRLLRSNLLGSLRFTETTDSRFILRWLAGISGTGSMASYLPEVPRGEERKIGVAGRHSVLHEKIRAGGWAEMPVNDHQGCGQRSTIELEDSKRVGQTIHAGTAETSGESTARGHRDRRDFNTERPRLPDSGQRSCSWFADLVWGKRSDGREHGHVLWMVRGKEERQHPVSGDGYVEGVRKLSQEERTASGNTIRQVSRDKAFGRSIGRDKEAGIRETDREGSPLHQGTEMGFVIKQGESDAGRESVAKSIVESQQAFTDGLFAQGNIWTVVELSDRRLGAAILRELESRTEVAATQALRKLCKTDRETLGWNSGLQQTREQSSTRFCGRAQQQDTGNSAQGIRTKGRRIFTIKSPNLYAGGLLN